jgi:type VII secretion integral membrane protein EccD
MPGTLRRVSVHTGSDDRAATVDLTLPSGLPVAQLIPSIVDIVSDQRDVMPRRWRLSRVGGRSLNESMTLAENEIHDGDLLVLSTAETPAPVFDECLTDAVAAAGPGEQPARVFAVAACLWAAGAGAVALAWASVPARVGHIVAAATLALAVGIAAIVTHRTRPDAQLCATLNIVAVLLAAAVGFVAVPAGPAAANFVLAAAAASSTSILLLRVTGCGTVWLTASTVFSATTAGAVATAVVWTGSPQMIGAGLATAALGMLGLAPRLSILVAGLAPAMPTADGDEDEQHLTVETAEDRAMRGHRVLTGLVVGSSAAAALGAVLVLMGCLRAGAPWPIAAAFTATIGLVLTLRARSHANGHCRTALIACGIISATAAFAIMAVAMPVHANWVGIVAVAAGLGSLAPVAGATVSPVIHRAVDLLEYLALAVVVPLACWVVDLYSVVRGLSLG